MAADLADIERGEELQLQETTVLVQEPDQSDWDDEKRKIYKIFKKVC